MSFLQSVVASRSWRAVMVMAVLLLAAHPPKLAAQAKNCGDAPTQLEMNQCQQKQASEADAALNALYRSVMEKLGAQDKARLRTAQRAWITYRDASCDAETALYEGGSMAPLIKSACLTKLTDDRVAEIKRIYSRSLEKK